MIGFFIPIAEALFAGYLTSIAIYMALIFLLTRLGHRKLIRHNKFRSVYTALHAIVWAIAALAGAYICCGLSPLPPYGLLGFPVCLAFGLTIVLLRNFRQLPRQMSISALLLNLGSIFGGTFLALYVRHIFMILRNS